MNKLLILTYHAIDSRPSVTSVSPELFRWQMETLAAQGLTGISLANAYAHLERSGRFPDKSVVLSFDDGYLSLMDEVVPVMQSLGFSATLFIVSGMVGMSAIDASTINPDIDRDMLGWQQLESLAASGFEIGSHTITHPRLTKLSALDVEHELVESKHTLQQRLQLPVNSFAYPYGALNQTISKTASGYYAQACTTRLGRNSSKHDRMQLKRVDMYYLSKPATFLKLCNGGLEGYLHLRQYLREFRQYFT